MIKKNLPFIKIHRKYSFPQEWQPTVWESDFFVSSYWATSYKTRLVLSIKFLCQAAQVRGGAPDISSVIFGELSMILITDALKARRYLTDFAQVAELGGTFGLFVGFSFLGVFDVFVNISCTAKNIFFKPRT